MPGRRTGPVKNSEKVSIIIIFTRIFENFDMKENNARRQVFNVLQCVASQTQGQFSLVTATHQPNKKEASSFCFLKKKRCFSFISIVSEVGEKQNYWTSGENKLCCDFLRKRQRDWKKGTTEKEGTGIFYTCFNKKLFKSCGSFVILFRWRQLEGWIGSLYQWCF